MVARTPLEPMGRDHGPPWGTYFRGLESPAAQVAHLWLGSLLRAALTVLALLAYGLDYGHEPPVT